MFARCRPTRASCDSTHKLERHLSLDYIGGALLLSAPFLRLTPGVGVATVVVYFALHLVVSAIGFVLGVKDSPL